MVCASDTPMERARSSKLNRSVVELIVEFCRPSDRLPSSCGHGPSCAMRVSAKVWIMFSSADTTSGRERMVSSGRPSGGVGGGSGRVPCTASLFCGKRPSAVSSARTAARSEASVARIESSAMARRDSPSTSSSRAMEPASKRVCVMRKVWRWRSSEPRSSVSCICCSMIAK